MLSNGTTVPSPAWLGLSNIVVEHLDIAELFRDTPLEKWLPIAMRLKNLNDLVYPDRQLDSIATYGCREEEIHLSPSKWRTAPLLENFEKFEMLPIPKVNWVDRADGYRRHGWRIQLPFEVKTLEFFKISMSKMTAVRHLDGFRYKQLSRIFHLFGILGFVIAYATYPTGDALPYSTNMVECI